MSISYTAEFFKGGGGGLLARCQSGLRSRLANEVDWAMVAATVLSWQGLDVSRVSGELFTQRREGG